MRRLAAMDDRTTEKVLMEEVRLLETDPDSFFDSPKRVPFGFVLRDAESDR